ncbi:MAG: family 43 glycosylhydrolase [Bacteroidetes bacterium]|nr:family 43 glycosylhydrolase [Bacteroidota bacterium]
MKQALLLLSVASALILSSCQPKKQSANNNVPDWALLPFVKIDSVNPILGPGNGSFTDPIRKVKVSWEEKDVFNPAIVKKDNKVYMLYRAQDRVGKPAGTSRIGLAVSSDAMHFTRMPEPVLYPDNDTCKKYEWEGGCEDPRVVRDDKGTYYMTYTAFDGTLARLFEATSTDLVHWRKYGSVFAKAEHGKYVNIWSKSGSIVSVYKDGQPEAVKINGKYWMYWGDTQIWAATSDDLINWAPVEMQPGEKSPSVSSDQSPAMANLKVAIPTRPGKFDSELVESGPPAMLTDKGIVLIYNSRNKASGGDPSLAKEAYAASEILFDKNDPTKIVDRMNTWFMKPDKPYEIGGQVNQVCFVEGLTALNGKWYLYYGTADSKIAVAACDVRPAAK